MWGEGISAEVERQLLEILKEAIEKEKDSQEHFQRGVDLSTHLEIRGMFLQLLAEEKQHERLLMKRYVEIKKRLGLKVMREEEEAAGEQSTE